jgi:hypothetical protein
MAAKFYLLNPGHLVEIRFLGPRTWALFTSDAEVIASALERPEVAGLNAYQTLNPLSPRTPEKHGVQRDILFLASRGQLSSDEDVERRRGLLLDSDVVKPTGTAATDAQRKAAHQHSRELQEHLTAEGWPLPLAFDSGNGGHGVYRTDLPNDRETSFLLSNFLQVAARKFNTATVKLDKGMFNASRITRLYGCRNFKAGRDSAVLSIPPEIIPVTLEQIKSVLGKWRGTLGFKKPLIAREGGWTPERIESFLNFYSIDYRPPTEIAAGLLWVLSPCPLNADHVGTSPGVILTRSGWPKFKCLHDGCGQMRWGEFCKRLYRLTGKWFICHLKNPS